MPVAFDTHQFIQRLIHGNLPLEQAEAISAALQEALEASIGQLATKADIADVRKDMSAMDTRIANEFKHLKWMIGVNMTLTLLILGKLLLFKA